MKSRRRYRKRRNTRGGARRGAEELPREEETVPRRSSRSVRKVLVLCQRKTGPLNYGTVTVDGIVQQLEEYVQSLFPGEEVRIEYMSSMNGLTGTVDYKMDLNEDFSQENRGEYDLVLLHTCPFPFMKYNLIHALLKPGGYMTFKSFDQNKMRSYNVTQTSMFREPNDFTKIQSPLNDDDTFFYVK